MTYSLGCIDYECKYTLILRLDTTSQESYLVKGQFCLFSQFIKTNQECFKGKTDLIKGHVVVL